ncbi:MAG: hypothetical protein ACI4HJ_04985 [Ruminococcus sp.]
MKESLVIKKLIEMDDSKDMLLRRSVVPAEYDNKYAAFCELCAKAKDFDEFIESYINSEVFEYSNGAYEIYMRFFPEKLWYKLRELMGDNCRKTYADAGCLKIGNDAFTFMINNGRGDGEVRYAVLDYMPEWYSWFGESFNSFEVLKDESVFIYKYDCGNEKLESIPKGKYFAKSYQGLVLITKYRDID